MRRCKLPVATQLQHRVRTFFANFSAPHSRVSLASRVAAAAQLDTMTGPSTDQVSAALQELLSEADLETTTETSLEKALTERFAADMSDHRPLILVRRAMRITSLLILAKESGQVALVHRQHTGRTLRIILHRR